MQHYLAFDLGAESGRAILGTLNEGVLSLEDLHRFPNIPVRVFSGLYWDTLRLWHEIQEGLRVAGRERKLELTGIGIDTWGVDFGLVGADGALVDNPRHYRDARNNGMMEKTFAAVPREEIFAHTGLQFMQFNTLYQLYALKLAGSPALETAKTLLMMPDLLNYWMTGIARSDVTIASTSQFYNPAAKRWSTELFDKLGLPSSILPPIIQPGTLLGPLLPWVAEPAGLAPSTPVYVTAGHDTAAAVAAVPAEGENWCYISSGTWSLLGVELDEPIINDQCHALTLTNEIGVEGKVRLLKNIAGLWLLQESRKAWALQGEEYDYATLARLAEAAKPFTAVIDPDAFLEPGSMPERIAEYCRRTSQPVPGTVGETCRTVLESLALRYREVLESVEKLQGRKIHVIHLVGGGSRNTVLDQFVANATAREVLAGPSEATAIGNILVQAIGSGKIKDLSEARQVVRRSFEIQRFIPRPSEEWDRAYERFRLLPRG